jgi:undecaprenyl phosphate-alpha-L-ara4N flippase subunit ArnE
MKTKPWAVMLVIICTLFTAFGQFFYKIGMQRPMPNFYSIATNYPLIVGLLLYAVASIFLIVALKHGDLSLLYPLVSLSFIWVSLLALFYFSEILPPANWIGITSIVIGIGFMGYGERHG